MKLYTKSQFASFKGKEHCFEHFESVKVVIIDNFRGPSSKKGYAMLENLFYDKATVFLMLSKSCLGDKRSLSMSLVIVAP